MTLKITKPGHNITEKFRTACMLFAEKRASIDYVLSVVKKLRLIQEVKK